MMRLETFPPALPLDGAELIAAADDWQLFLFAIGFSIVCLGLAFVAAVMFSRSAPPKASGDRPTQAVSGEATSPDVVASPFPNLLTK